MNFLDSFWNLINSALFNLNGNLVLTIGLLVITAFFVFFLKKFKTNTNQVHKDLIEANKLLDFSDKHRNSFYKDFDKINEALLNNPSFAHHWHEFKEHIIFPTEIEASQKSEDELEIKNSIQPGFFFNEETFVEDNIDLRFLDSIPGKLTGLGILGTFIGLTIGIASATVGLKGVSHSVDTSQLLNTLTQLLSGASLAFTTSVLGIVYSMWFSFLEKKKIKDIRDQLKQFVQNLEKSLLFITNEQISLEINANIVEQNKKFDGFSNELTIALENALKNAFESPLRTGISEIVGGLSSIKEVQQGFSDNLMNELVDKLSGGLKSEANTSQQKASEAFQNLQDTFAKQAAEMVSSQNTMAATSRQLLNEISQTSKSNQEALNQQLNNTIGGLKSALDEINNSFKENINNSSENIKNTLDKTFNHVSDNIIQQQQNMNSKMESSANNLAALVDRIAEIMSDGSRLMEVTNENINKNNNITEKYRGLITEQEKVFGLLQNCSANINNSSQLFNTAGDRLLNASQNLEKTGNKLTESNQNLENIWSNYNERFENVDKSLGEAFSVFVQGSNQFHTTVNEYVSGLTKEYEKAINILGGQLEELADALSESKKNE